MLAFRGKIMLRDGRRLNASGEMCKDADGTYRGTIRTWTRLAAGAYTLFIDRMREPLTVELVRREKSGWPISMDFVGQLEGSISNG